MYNNDVINNLYVEGNNNNIDSDMSNETMMSNQMSAPMNMNMGTAPIMGQGQEKVVHRTFVHDVPHICPIHTRVINHHVYRHIYQPKYTCSEENCVTNIQCGSCCQFQ
ncbi:MAG: hypothetical protein IJ193_02555 [Bacilli bacterium]|nr:hypothetical protein [Bacilli bacterium]